MSGEAEELRGAKHPLIAFGERRGWDYSATADRFSFDYGHFKQLVTGWVGLSLKRAQECAAKSGGEFSSMDLLLWHQANRRSTGEPRPGQSDGAAA